MSQVTGLVEECKYYLNGVTPLECSTHRGYRLLIFSRTLDQTSFLPVALLCTACRENGAGCVMVDTWREKLS